MLPIQRVPRGLSDVLTIFGGVTPQGLGDEVRGSVELLQMYGLTQWQCLSNSNAALAEAGTIELTVPVNNWWLLYGVHGVIVKTATMTALRAHIGISPQNTGAEVQNLVAEELGPFGATENGTIAFCHVCPYPRLMPPNSRVIFRLSILGTDATANCGVTASVGVLG